MDLPRCFAFTLKSGWEICSSDLFRLKCIDLSSFTFFSPFSVHLALLGLSSGQKSFIHPFIHEREGWDLEFHSYEA